jgi:pimeloyl-ACP methyl ester carboxylesterase
VGYLDRDGHQVCFETTAARASRAGAHLPVLLSHGFGASSAMWEPNVGALAADRQVITWDMRGHGRSGSPDDPAQYSEAACVADMAAVLDACGAPRAVVGGLSLGGYMSLAFWLAHPERVAGLLLCDTGPGYRRDEARQLWNDSAIATAARLERDGLTAVRDSPETRAARAGSAQGLAHAARGMLAQRDASVIGSLPAIPVPVLVLVGARDEPFLAAADYMAAKIPGAVRTVIAGAGHASNIDQPELFNQQVLTFLDQIARA